jgi:hypothetical protein
LRAWAAMWIQWCSGFLQAFLKMCWSSTEVLLYD